MINIKLICVGKLKEAYLRDACAEYIKRLKGVCRFSLTEVSEERLTGNLSKAQIESAVYKEGRRIVAKIDKKSVCVALCIEGDSMSSPKLARYLQDLSVNGHGEVTFIIGGSWGLSNEVKSASDLLLSMSLMTFPHMLARVMLLEQLYRVSQIVSGGSYHK